MTPAGVGGFWDPPEIPNGSQIALFGIDRRLWLQKCSPGAVLKKNMKNPWKMDRKINDF
jgi:hypothetical protein